MTVPAPVSTHAPTSAPAPAASLVRLPLGFVNAYLARTPSGFALVDTGLPGSWPQLAEALAAAGCTRENLRLVVLTHGDLDHAGCAKRLQAEWGVPVAVHPGDLGMVQNGDFQDRRGRTPAVRLAMRLIRRSRRSRPDPNAPDSPYFTPDVLLADGMSLAAYGWDATVVHAPGHTAGSVALLTPEGDLIVGDTAANQVRPGPGMLIQDRAAFDRTLAALAALPAKTVHPGHGRPFPIGKLPKRV